MSDKILAIVGVGPGLGQAVAERFAREGFSLALIARRAQALDDHVKSLAKQGIRALGVAADAGDPGALIQAFRRIDDAMGTPSVLVYNAAVMRHAAPSALDPEDMVKDFRVNVVGAVVAAQQVVPAMKAQKSGTILLTGGSLALTPFPALASLAVGKAGIRNLAHSLAGELEDHGIHVATVTICGLIKPDTHFAPDRIAEVYWQLHSQPRDAWEREHIYESP